MSSLNNLISIFCSILLLHMSSLNNLISIYDSISLHNISKLNDLNILQYIARLFIHTNSISIYRKISPLHLPWHIVQWHYRTRSILSSPVLELRLNKIGWQEWYVRLVTGKAGSQRRCWCCNPEKNMTLLHKCGKMIRRGRGKSNEGHRQ